MPEPLHHDTGDAAGNGPALASLIDETRSLFHRLRVAAEEAHGQGELSAARRSVLLGLHRGGAQTVPQMARARPVSRQHIQALVDRLAAEGYVVRTANPAHRRSRLVALTARGRQAVERMETREHRLLAVAAKGLGGRDLLAAAEVLRKVRARFESRSWKRAARAARGAPG